MIPQPNILQLPEVSPGVKRVLVCGDPMFRRSLATKVDYESFWRITP